MAKGDDAIRRKKNRADRKRKRKEFSSKVSARVASIMASKQRRKSGKRRICEGMCFSLPTPEDPFNDRYEHKAWNKKKAQELAPDQSASGVSPTKKVAAPKQNFSDKSSAKFVKQREPEKNKFGNGTLERREIASLLSEDLKSHVDTGKPTLSKGGVPLDKQQGSHGTLNGSLKFLSSCLNAIQNALKTDSNLNDGMDRPLLFNMWGFEFWKCCQNGLDVVETSGACSSIEQIAWIVSTATDAISSMDRKVQSLACPFLLFLVPSQEKALEVRSVCKSLKEVGIHTVSLHTGASIDHQIHGLKRCDPEFIISTPERLWELISLKAIDISELSLLVVDGLQTFVRDGLLDEINFIKQSIQGSHVTVVFNNGFEGVSASALQNLVKEPICRLSISDSIASQSGCIYQCVHACASEEKLLKGIQILNLESTKESWCEQINVLFVVRTSSDAQTYFNALIADGYSAPSDALSDGLYLAYSEKTMVSVTDVEAVGDQVDIGKFVLVIIVDFPTTIDLYVRILTRMARQSVHGSLHSLLCEEDAPLAGQLIQVLEECGQIVPQTLSEYHNSSSMLEH